MLYSLQKRFWLYLPELVHNHLCAPKVFFGSGRTYRVASPVHLLFFHPVTLSSYYNEVRTALRAFSPTLFTIGFSCRRHEREESFYAECSAQ
jgi:hypothetical protein